MFLNSSFDSCLSVGLLQRFAADGCPGIRRLRCATAEGFLPPVWALAGGGYRFYPACGMGWCAYGVLCRRITHQKVPLALCGAFIFVPSALKNSVGNGELFTSDRRWSGGYLVSPGVVRLWRGCAVVSGVIAGYGGLTTLGANGMSMAVIGPVVGYLVWKMACRAGLRRRDVAAFLCAMLADLATYFVTSVQLGVALPDPLSCRSDCGLL